MMMTIGVVRACERALGRYGARLGNRQRTWRSAAVELSGTLVMPVRHFETGSTTGSVMQETETEVLKSLVGGMMNHARGFPIKGDGVEILGSPSQFYNALLQGVRDAQFRVVIASLYIGTGSLEQELIRSPGNRPCRSLYFAMLYGQLDPSKSPRSILQVLPCYPTSSRQIGLLGESQPLGIDQRSPCGLDCTKPQCCPKW